MPATPLSPALPPAQSPLKPQLEPSWLAAVGGEFRQAYLSELKRFLIEERRRHQVFPPGRLMFNAFAQTPFDAVRVVILGQDPYHGPGQAHGLCFSVARGTSPPPSLQNVFIEINQTIGIDRPNHGDLTCWARQGVLLLNTVLSVRARQANSHRDRGWERFTDAVIRALVEGKEGLVFVLWGAAAGRKAAMIDRRKHVVLRASHPSPRSADRGFFGCDHFRKINAHLVARGQGPIDWSIPD